MRFDKLTQAIAAGGVWRLGMAANDLQIVSSSAPISVTLYKGGAVIGAGSRVLAGDYFRGVDFDLIEVASDEAQNVTILLSDGASGSNRIVGEVSVINGELSRVKKNQAFAMSINRSGSAGVYSAVQLLNPADSGVNAYITKISVFTSVAGVRVAMRAANTALGATIAGESKKIGGAQSKCLGARALLASSLPGAGLLTVASGIVSHTREFELMEPVLIAPGFGVGLDCLTTDVQLASGFQWFEEPIE